MNPTVDTRFKKGGALIDLSHYQSGKHGLRSSHFHLLMFFLHVRDCLVGLGGQHVRDGLAAVEISRSSFRQFFFFFNFLYNIISFH
jgi:hypothetical protein